MRRDDDLFLETLEQDERTAWALAEAAARPAPARLRDRIVARHRRRTWSVPRILFAGVAAAATLVLVLAFGTGPSVTRLSGEGGDRAAVVATRSGDALLLVALPAPPSGKTYEAWVIRDGEALPAGLTDGTGVVALRAGIALRAGDVIAITVESSGGASRPTSAPILVGRL